MSMFDREEDNYRKLIFHYPKKILKGIPSYCQDLVPIISWCPRYNRRWLMGDMVAGLTVGLMIVPQSLAYAKLANLPVVYGLYTSYLGAIIYAFMGTSREIAVGPSAVLSLLVGTTVLKVQQDLPELTKPEIAMGICILSGLITLVLGLFRLGSLLDLVPHPVVIGFTTGSAMTIILSQVPTLLGIPDVSSSDMTPILIKKLVMNTIHLSWLDLLIGLSSLFFLQLINLLTLRFSSRVKPLRYVKVASNALCIIIFTTITYLIYQYHPNQIQLKIVGYVPSGFGTPKLPPFDPSLLSHLSLDIIPIVLIGVLEHVAIAKAFSKQSGYNLNSSQELVALGVGNILTSMVGGYPTTGSFSRTAVNSQSGVRTPAGGLWTGGLVILALWWLTPCFYYIPSASLAAIIINSAISLITIKESTLKLWRINRMDSMIYLVAVVVTFLAGAEYGMLSSLILSFLVVIYHLTQPHLTNSNYNNPTITPSSLPINFTLPPPGLLIYRPTTPLLFLNSSPFSSKILHDVITTTLPPTPTLSDTITTTNNEPLWCENLITRTKRLNRASLTAITYDDKLPQFLAVIIDLTDIVCPLDSSFLEGLHSLYHQLQLYSSPTGNSPSTSPPLHFITTSPTTLCALHSSHLLLHPTHLDTKKLDLNQLPSFPSSTSNPSQYSNLHSSLEGALINLHHHQYQSEEEEGLKVVGRKCDPEVVITSYRL